MTALNCIICVIYCDNSVWSVAYGFNKSDIPVVVDTLPIYDISIVTKSRRLIEALDLLLLELVGE